MTDTRPVVPLINELRKRIRMLEGCLEVDGQLHRQGCRELLDTLRRMLEVLEPGEIRNWS